MPADLAGPPALVGREVGEIGTMAFPRMEDVIAAGAHRREHSGNWRYGRAGEPDVIAHGIDVAALAAEIRLHVDDDERCIRRRHHAVEGPLIGVGFDHILCPLI